MIGVAALKRIKGQQHLTEAAEHNKRTRYAQGKASDKIDPLRSHLNFSLGGCDDPGAIVAKWLQLRDAAGVPTPGRKNEVSAIEFVLSLPPGAEAVINLHGYFTDGTDFVCTMFGGRENLLSADVHLDQEQPHCHILIMPLINGKMAGAQLIRGAGPNYSKLHDDFHRQVASRYGLKKPEPKLHGKSKEDEVQAVLAWLDSLADDGERWRATAALTKKSVRRDPRPYRDAPGPRIEPSAGRQPKTFKQIALSPGRGPKTQAAAHGSDLRLMVRRSPSAQVFQSVADSPERYIAFPVSSPVVEATAKPPPGPEACPATKGYALYSVSSSLQYLATIRSHCSRHRKGPTSAAVDALMAPASRPTMGTH